MVILTFLIDDVWNGDGEDCALIDHSLSTIDMWQVGDGLVDELPPIFHSGKCVDTGRNDIVEHCATLHAALDCAHWRT